MKTISKIEDLYEIVPIERVSLNGNEIITIRYGEISMSTRDWNLEKLVLALKGLGCEIEYKKPTRLIDDEIKFLHFLKNHNFLTFEFLNNEFYADNFETVGFDYLKKELGVEFDFTFLEDIPLNE